jgi:hypothetical protein
VIKNKDVDNIYGLKNYDYIRIGEIKEDKNFVAPSTDAKKEGKSKEAEVKS